MKVFRDNHSYYCANRLFTGFKDKRTQWETLRRNEWKRNLKKAVSYFTENPGEYLLPLLKSKCHAELTEWDKFVVKNIVPRMPVANAFNSYDTKKGDIKELRSRVEELLLPGKVITKSNYDPNSLGCIVEYRNIFLPYIMASVGVSTAREMEELEYFYKTYHLKNMKNTKKFLEQDLKCCDNFNRKIIEKVSKRVSHIMKYFNPAYILTSQEFSDLRFIFNEYADGTDISQPEGFVMFYFTGMMLTYTIMAKAVEGTDIQNSKSVIKAIDIFTNSDDFSAYFSDVAVKKEASSKEVNNKETNTKEKSKVTVVKKETNPKGNTNTTTTNQKQKENSKGGKIIGNATATEKGKSSMKRGKSKFPSC